MGRGVSLPLDLRFLNPASESAERCEVMKRLLRGFSKLSVFMSKDIPDRLETSLAKGSYSRVQVLEGVAAVIPHQAKSRYTRFRRIDTEALTEKPAIGGISPTNLCLQCQH